MCSVRKYIYIDVICYILIHMYSNDNIVATAKLLIVSERKVLLLVM